MNNRRSPNTLTASVEELLARMTIEEKVAQLSAYYMYDLQTNGVLDMEKVKGRLAHGIGQITRIGGASTYLPQEQAKVYNQIQHFLLNDTRLGIPAIVHEECCAGLMAPGASIFPQMVGLASTFRPELARQMTDRIRKQMLAVGARQGLGPVLDVARDPRWGRVEETFGEDPTLVSQFGVEYVRGLQGENLSQGVMATGKHFVGHSFSQGGLNCGPVHIGWRDLWDVYLAPFQAAIRDAGLASMMNAYPEIDGEVVAASKRILTDLLRGTLGFDGLVVSDYQAVMMIHNYHRIAETPQEAALMALSAGIDVELPVVECYCDDLMALVHAGDLPVETVDQAVRRHLEKKFELGLFENPYVDENNVISLYEEPGNRSLAYQIACQSMVLMKNDGVLPLQSSGLKIAVIGPNADSRRCMMGDYSYAALAELMRVVPAADSSFNNLTEEGLNRLTVDVSTIREALQERVAADELIYARGCGIMDEDRSGFEEAVKAAQEADVAVLVMGGQSGLAPYCSTGEFRDASDLRLTGVQEELVKAVQATGKPVVLVLVDGRPVALPNLVKECAAILEAWVPGEEGARAIVDTLFGVSNPGGKLPISFPRSAGQVPVFYNHKPSGMRSNIYGDYVNEPVSPLFPFGHGLSYTRFAYSDLKIGPETARAGETVAISCKVRNDGDRVGDEVVQLYLCDLYASMPRPVKELRGFARVSLQPGESRIVVFHLPVNQMAFFDANLELVLEPGKFMVMIGASSADIRLEGTFGVVGETARIEQRVFACPVEII